MSEKNILITGGTGLLGNHLQKLLKENNYRVHILTRNPGKEINSFKWDVGNKFIDPRSLEQTGTIIHLTGAGIADKRWTADRKKEIIDSRVKSADLLFETLKNNSHSITTFISASAIGIYGDSQDKWVDENHSPAKDFLGETCRKWEAAANRFSTIGIRVVVLRIGIVLAKEGGALPQLAMPVRFFIGSPLGNGKQYMSWIHIDDLCSIFLKAVEDEKLNGTYNAVASNPVRNKEFMKTLAEVLHRPLLPVNVPASVLKLLLGEKAKIVLEGQRVSNKKLMNTAFQFHYPELNSALGNIYST